MIRKLLCKSMLVLTLYGWAYNCHAIKTITFVPDDDMMLGAPKTCISHVTMLYETDDGEHNLQATRRYEIGYDKTIPQSLEGSMSPVAAVPGDQYYALMKTSFYLRR